MPQVGVRLAFRNEGNFWNCYIAQLNTMGDAKLIGSIAMVAVEENEEIKTEFMDLMKKVFDVALKATSGIDVDHWNEPQPAPEAERGGNA